jgi:hypothetical protein
MESTMVLNRAWHEKHRMPKNATLMERMRWHLAHRKHCRCRPIPAKLAETMKKRGLL